MEANIYSDDRIDQRKEEEIVINDNYELLSKFALEPNLKHYDYPLAHINKNLILSNADKEQVPIILRQLENITIFKKFKEEIKENVLVGYEPVQQEDGSVLHVPHYKEETVIVSRFRNLDNFSATQVFGRTSLSAGAKLALVKQLKTNIYQKEQTIEDKTETKRGWFSKKAEQ